MTKLPLTRVEAGPEKAQAIREAVRRVAFPGDATRRLVSQADAEAFQRLVADPRVSGPIYTLPKPPTLDAARDFIARHVGEHERGEGLLILEFDKAGEVAAYHDVQFWPEWAACELGGAIRPDRQGAGRGGTGAEAAFNWLFDEIGVDLICETAALDNVRTRKLLERIGFRLIGEIESELQDGGARPSFYFEMTRAERDQRRSSMIG